MKRIYHIAFFVVCTQLVIGQTTPVLLKDISPEQGNSYVNNSAIVYKNRLYFAANDGQNGAELWSTDGTEAGTSLFLDINPGQANSSPSNFYILGDKLVFTASHINFGTELWITDGTDVGTVLIKDIFPGSGSSIFLDASPENNFGVFNNQLYFAANDNTNGFELWKTDGTTTGTFMLKNINPFFNAEGHSFPAGFTEFKGLMYCSARGTAPNEIWTTDGTPDGTKLLKVVSTSLGIEPGNFCVLNDVLLFTGDDGNINAQELWKIDGTTIGTVMVKNIDPTPYYSGFSTSPNTFENRLVRVGNTVYFSATNGVNGAELWKTDGTEAGTVMVKDASNDQFGYAPQNFAVLNNVLYYKYDDDVTGQELWRSNGTSSGTYMVKDLSPGSNGSFSLPTEIKEVNGKIYMGAFTNNSFNKELYVSDGTDNGTKLLQDINPAGSSFPTGFTKFGNGMFFWAFTDAKGNEPYVFSVVSSIDVVQLDANIVVTPTLTDGHFHIYSKDADFDQFQLEILNNLGVSVAFWGNARFDTPYSVQHQPAGVYFVRITHENRSKTCKIVISK